MQKKRGKGTKARKRSDGLSLFQKVTVVVLASVMGLFLQRAFVWQELHSKNESDESGGATPLPVESLSERDAAQNLRQQVRQIIHEEFDQAKQELERAITDVRDEGRKVTAESIKLAQELSSAKVAPPQRVEAATVQAAATTPAAIAPAAATAAAAVPAASAAAAAVPSAPAAVDTSTTLDAATKAKVVKVQEQRLVQIKLLDAPCKLSEAMDKENKADEAWCKEKQSAHGVVVQQTWGSMKGTDQATWVIRGCDGVALHGKKLECADKWGTKYLETWQASAKPVCTPGAEGTSSSIVQKDSALGHTMYDMANVQLDFSRMSDKRGGKGTRSFGSGFLGASGCVEGAGKLNVHVPPSGVQQLGGLQCDVWDDTPTFVMGHDDIFNFGHRY
jgi:hypothetical protein